MIKIGRYLYMNSLRWEPTYQVTVRLKIFDCIEPLSPTVIETTDLDVRLSHILHLKDDFYLTHYNGGLTFHLLEWEGMYPQERWKMETGQFMSAPVKYGDYLFTIDNKVIYIYKINYPSNIPTFTKYQ